MRRRAGYKAFMLWQQERGADFVQAARQKSYQLAPRATIFRRDAGGVADLASLKRLMRSNSYSTDPVSPLADHALPGLPTLQSDHVMLPIPQQRYLRTLPVTSSPLQHVQSNQKLWHRESIKLTIVLLCSTRTATR